MHITDAGSFSGLRGAHRPGSTTSTRVPKHMQTLRPAQLGDASSHFLLSCRGGVRPAPRAVVPLCTACFVLSNRAERRPLQLCPECWLLGAGDDSRQGPPVLALALARPEIQEAGGVCSVLGLLSSEGPMQFRSCLALSSVAQPLPHSSAIPECPGHWKPNLKGSQRPGLQQSELENITIVPLET